MRPISKALRLFALDLERATRRLWLPNAATGALKRRVARHHTLCERLCNEADDAGRLQKRLDECEAAIRGMLGQDMPGVTRITFSHDPRGGTVHLHLESERYNSLGGLEEGWVL